MKNEICQFEKGKNSKSVTKKEKEIDVIELNKKLDKKLNNLYNSFEELLCKSYEKSEDQHTICLDCKKNCHEPCNCSFNLIDRCIIFSWGILNYKQCEICGCDRNRHQTVDYHWIYQKIKIKKDTTHKSMKEDEEIEFLKRKK